MKTNIENIFAASDPNATPAEKQALYFTLRVAVGKEWNAMNNELGGGSVPNPAVWNLSAFNNPLTNDQFNGGHFVLSGVTIADIQGDLGGPASADYLNFVKDFTGRITGDVSVPCPAKLPNTVIGSTHTCGLTIFTFHFDDFSPFNNPAGHLAVDVGLGRLPGVCLDPAWH